MTHNSLAANQRPNIGLIDRRHFDDPALPIRITERCTTGVYVNAEAVTRPLTALSHINVLLCGGPMPQAFDIARRSRPVRSSTRLDGIMTAMRLDSQPGRDHELRIQN